MQIKSLLQDVAIVEPLLFVKYRVIILKKSCSSNGNVIIIHEQQMEHVFHYLMKKNKKQMEVCSYENAEHVCGSKAPFKANLIRPNYNIDYN
jgi:hypothetical protein